MSGGTAIGLRPARLDDAARLLAWANDPATRAASFGREPIPWESHLAWLKGVLEDPDRRLWIGEESGAPFGQLRVDRTPDGVGLVSIGLAPEARGRGLGRLLLRGGLASAIQELGIRRARAIVVASNASSRRLFECAGFVQVAGAGVPGHPAAVVLEAEAAELLLRDPAPPG